MNPEDRQKLKDAFKKFAENHPAPDSPVLGFMGAAPVLSPNEWVQELEKETEAAEVLLEMFAWGVEKDGIDKVVERLEKPSNREKIIHALRKWVKNHPHPDEILLDIGETEISPRDILEQIEEGTSLGKHFMEMLEDAAREMGSDEVIERLTASPGP